MAFRDIVVLVDSADKSAKALDQAVRLAQRHDAHLIGLHVRPLPQLPNYVVTQLGPDVLDIQRRWNDEAAAAAKALFARKTVGMEARCEWRDVDGPLLEQVPLHARYADLVVTTQYEPGSESQDGQAEVVDQLVLGSGRPVLVVPYAGTFEEVGRRVMVAWNATREATRAVADAMPFLKAADRVEVVSVNGGSGSGRDGHGDIPSADICLHLARHGVKAEAEHIMAVDLDVGDALLSRCADEAIDLLVMGAYGRSRLREMILGGATRNILRQMTVPVLMSH